MTIFTDLFPKQNRKAAAVAFVRTCWQAVTGSSVVVGLGGYAFTATGLIRVDWAGLGIALGGVAAIGVLSGLKAGGNILVNGLPATYQALAAAAAPDVAPAVPVISQTPAK